MNEQVEVVPKFKATLIPQTLAGWNVPRVSGFSQQAAIDHQLYIYNVGPRTHTKHTPLGPYTIMGCPDGREYGEPCIVPGIIFETVPTSNDGRNMEVREVDGRAFANDLIGIGPHQVYTSSLVRQGVFISPSRVPSPEDLEAAHKELEKLYSEWLVDGDQKLSYNNGMRDFGGGVSASVVSERHSEAAKYLGVQRTYMKSQRRQIECDQCGESNIATASRCKACRKVFNEEVDRRNFPYDYEVSEAPRRGRPRNEVTL